MTSVRALLNTIHDPGFDARRRFGARTMPHDASYVDSRSRRQSGPDSAAPELAVIGSGFAGARVLAEHHARDQPLVFRCDLVDLPADAFPFKAQLPDADGRGVNAVNSVVQMDCYSTVREVDLRLYESDGTVEIVETKAQRLRGSGEVSRAVYARRRAPDRPLRAVDVAAAAGGGAVTVFSQLFFVKGAGNALTMERLEAQGARLPLAEDTLWTKQGLRHDNGRRFPAGHRRVKRMAPEEDVGVILRFFAEMDDGGDTSAYEAPGDKADRIPLTLLYFLEDGTVQVKERSGDKARSGRLPFLTIMARGPLPRFDELRSSGESGYPSASDKLDASGRLCRLEAAGVVAPRDIRVGGTIDVFGKTLHVLDADSATRQWYREHLGAELAKSLIPEAPDGGDAHAHAAADGAELFGLLRDGDAGDGPGLAGVRERREVAHRHTVQTLRDHASAKKQTPLQHFVSSHGREAHQAGVEGLGAGLPEIGAVCVAAECPSLLPTRANEGREFSVRYFLADDTIEIYEMIKPNSGHRGGRTVARKRHVSPEGVPYRIWHICVGEELRIAGKRYKITAEAPRSRRWMEAWEEKRLVPITHLRRAIAGAQDPLAALATLTRLFRHQGPVVHSVTSMLSAKGDRVSAQQSSITVTYEDLAFALEDMLQRRSDRPLAGGEMVDLLAALDPEGVGEVEYLSLCGLLAGRFHGAIRDDVQRLWRALGGTAGGAHLAGAEVPLGASNAPPGIADELVVDGAARPCALPDDLRAVIIDPLLIDGAVHYLDFFLHLANVASVLAAVDDVRRLGGSVGMMRRGGPGHGASVFASWASALLE